MTAPDIERAMKPQGMIPGEASPEERTALILERIARYIMGQEGRVPNFYVIEFALAAAASGDARTTINADFEPDRWVVWQRTVANGKFRVSPGDFVPAGGATNPAEGAVEVESGSRAILESVGQRLSFHNPSTTVDAHIFAVAIGGGSAFDIGGV